MSQSLNATARRPPRNFWVGSSPQKSLPAVGDEAAHLPDRGRVEPRYPDAGRVVANYVRRVGTWP
jgi:hypothetical protein